ncbi:alpha/beta hydrolase [Neotamlana laminarinivorans]|uniref:Esterase family protein n=1 Tax=Neotamlana laminarinivorans TaxID=2883124 RepID=A0A9X1I0S4_9FLAO|nr:alpha/beta hydrolase family protein [Tamlana laminarinivorans]MCB4798830.1 esterase family protein [Tamlana laminarinivorans]
MKKYLLFTILICSSFKLFASNVDTLSVFSKSMNKTIKNVVITPDSYPEKNKTYAVVYLLHGAWGDYKSWLEISSEIKNFADVYDVILVCPDGHESSWYFDSPIDASMRYETYISKELVSKIDADYKTKAQPEFRAITGLSMGGHGALYLAFKHQDIWGVAASMSGGVDVRGFPLRWHLAERLGTYAEHPENWENHMVINLTHLLDGEKLKFMFDCGTDDFFYNANVRLHKKLLERNIPHDYIERPGGHTKKYWRNAIKYHMLYFNEFFNQSN